MHCYFQLRPFFLVRILISYELMSFQTKQTVMTRCSLLMLKIFGTKHEDLSGGDV